ncbi:36150_t:CDS:2 [Gigaspora margarita]|uniref:36150_t:CDS:1 n=1 Tax=Gigaspora margarita TaxID=4874 RepID=A0ABN7V021_GIGMA|nr:36150_t:CDS:2 [Gigaspora margarita]
MILNQLPNESITYRSFDSVPNDTHNLYQQEFLNCINTTEIPSHKLHLKNNAPVIYLCNLDPVNGLCNGTKLIYKSFSSNMIEAEIAIGNQQEKQHHWQLELNSLTQQEHERVDAYTTKFKKLLNCVNTNNCLLASYMGINAALVAFATSKSLSNAVAAARRVEAGNYYSQHNTEVAKQIRVGSELSDLKKRIDEMALNYAALTGKIKDAPVIPKNKISNSIICFQCKEIGHISHECVSKK